MTLFVAPTQNFLQTTLNGGITDAVDTITLTSATGFQAPGYIVIDRTNSVGTSTPTAREVVSYTGISGSDLTGCTRGADNSTVRQHLDGAVVETAPTVGMFNSLATIVATGFTSDGYLKAINSPVSIAQVYISTRLDVSGASITGNLGLYPVFSSPGAYSGPTVAIGGLLKVPKPGQLNWVSVITNFVVSTASVAFDLKKNGSSIFANPTTAPAIAAGGTYVSTASIATKNIDRADILRADVLSVGTDGFVATITIQAGS